jgi:hypothetical protein
LQDEIPERVEDIEGWEDLSPEEQEELREEWDVIKLFIDAFKDFGEQFEESPDDWMPDNWEPDDDPETWPDNWAEEEEYEDYDDRRREMTLETTMIEN